MHSEVSNGFYNEPLTSAQATNSCCNLNPNEAGQISVDLLAIPSVHTVTSQAQGVAVARLVLIPSPALALACVRPSSAVRLLEVFPSIGAADVLGSGMAGARKTHEASGGGIPANDGDLVLPAVPQIVLVDHGRA